MTPAPLPYFSGELHRRERRTVLGAVALLALLAGCGKGEPPAGGPGGFGNMPPLPVTVIEAQPRQVPTLIEAVGQTEGSKDIEVRARVAGILTQQLYKEGDQVQAGATLFTIDRAPFEIALTQARANLEQARANLEKAEREAARLTPLAAERAISQRDLDDATTALLTAQAAVASGEAQVRDAELNLSYTDVTAPIAGITDRAQFSVGTLVAPGAATNLLTTLHVIDPIWVRFAFSESEAMSLRKAGGKTEVKVVLPGGESYDLPGKLNFTASVIDPRTGMAQMRAELPNPGRTLLPGQFVRVQVSLGERQAYRVPQAALLQTEQGKMLFVVALDNTVAPRPVETDGWAEHDWVVTQGLKPGDKVIIDNLMKLRPGAPVMPHAPGEMPAAPMGAEKKAAH